MWLLLCGALDTELCAVLFITLIGVSVAAVALISLLLKNKGGPPKIKGSKLSDLKPDKYQSVGYVFLAFSFSLVGLVVTLLSSVVTGIIVHISGFCSTWYIVANVLAWISVSIILFLVLAFLYVGVGHLFNMTIMSDKPKGTLLGGLPCSKCLRKLVVWTGNVVSRGLFPPKVKR
ncbi:MAG: hypothetical protein J7L19_06500 [Dehalococcoidia bacterium]|nr:hypothetical protein [Dehalococcoidia bacterium]